MIICTSMTFNSRSTPMMCKGPLWNEDFQTIFLAVLAIRIFVEMFHGCKYKHLDISIAKYNVEMKIHFTLLLQM